jgi:hypothetical protein
MLKFYYFSNKIDAIQLDQNMTMKDMWRVLHVLQQENNNMCWAFEQLKARYLLYLRIPEVLSINKFSNQFQNLSENQESACQRNLMELDLNFEVLSIRFNMYSGYNLDNI